MGREDDGYEGQGSTYSWVIKDEYNEVVLQGTNEQPLIEDLPIGKYTIENTVKEFYPAKFGDGFVEDTSSESLKSQVELL